MKKYTAIVSFKAREGSHLAFSPFNAELIWEEDEELGGPTEASTLMSLQDEYQDHAVEPYKVQLLRTF